MSITSQWITDIEIGSPGSLTALMDGLTSLQSELPGLPTVAGLETLRCYRWRPQAPDAPCLYNTLMPSTMEVKDTNRFRDIMVISTRIGLRYVDDEDYFSARELYVDAYRALVDANFWDGMRTPPPIAGGATWAMRTSMQGFQEPFGDQTLQGIEFLQTFWLDRHPR